MTIIPTNRCQLKKAFLIFICKFVRQDLRSEQNSPSQPLLQIHSNDTLHLQPNTIKNVNKICEKSVKLIQLITFHADNRVMECSVRICHRRIQDCIGIRQVVCSSLALDRIPCDKSERRTNHLANLRKENRTDRNKFKVSTGICLVWFKDLSTHQANTSGRHCHRKCSVIVRFVRQEFRKPDQKKKQMKKKTNGEIFSFKIFSGNLPVSSILVRIERQSLRLPI